MLGSLQRVRTTLAFGRWRRRHHAASFGSPASSPSGKRQAGRNAIGASRTSGGATATLWFHSSGGCLFLSSQRIANGASGWRPRKTKGYFLQQPILNLGL